MVPEAGDQPAAAGVDVGDPGRPFEVVADLADPTRLDEQVDRADPARASVQLDDPGVPQEEIHAGHRRA